jgi:hypothetical protein
LVSWLGIHGIPVASALAIGIVTGRQSGIPSI